MNQNWLFMEDSHPGRDSDPQTDDRVGPVGTQNLIIAQGSIDRLSLVSQLSLIRVEEAHWPNGRL